VSKQLPRAGRVPPSSNCLLCVLGAAAARPVLHSASTIALTVDATIVAAGAPSLVQEGGHVGATDLLSSTAGEVLCCDMQQPVSQVRRAHGPARPGWLARWLAGGIPCNSYPNSLTFYPACCCL
jgi:hypothetical protein